MLISDAARRLKVWINIPLDAEKLEIWAEKVVYNSIGVNLRYNT